MKTKRMVSILLGILLTALFLVPSAAGAEAQGEETARVLLGDVDLDGEITAAIVSNAQPNIIQEFVDNLNESLPYYKRIKKITVSEETNRVKY